MAKKIPALDNLDLYSVNETISRINLALDELDRPQSSRGPEENKIIWRERVEVGSTEITKSDLDITAGTYRFHFEAKSGAVCDYYLYFNRDKTGANYRTVRITSSNGAAVQGSGDDNPIIGHNEADGIMSCTGTLTIDKQNNQVLGLFSYTRQPTDLLAVGSFHWEDFAAHEKINHLSLVSSVGGGLGKGSHIIIWRIADT